MSFGRVMGRQKGGMPTAVINDKNKKLDSHKYRGKFILLYRVCTEN